MNYAIYFGLAFAGCFLAFMLGILIMCWISDVFVFEGKLDKDYFK